MKKILFSSSLLMLLAVTAAHGQASENSATSPDAEASAPAVAASTTDAVAKEKKWGLCLGLLNEWKVGVYGEMPLTEVLGVQTGVAYVSDKYFMNNLGYYRGKSAEVKAHYIAVPLRVQAYVDLGLGIKHKAFLGVGIQGGYLLGGEIEYDKSRGYKWDHTPEKSEKIEKISLKSKHQGPGVKINHWTAHFLVGAGYEFLGHIQVSVESARRLTTVAKCENEEWQHWLTQLGVSYNLAKLF